MAPIGSFVLVSNAMLDLLGSMCPRGEQIDKRARRALECVGQFGSKFGIIGRHSREQLGHQALVNGILTEVMTRCATSALIIPPSTTPPAASIAAINVVSAAANLSASSETMASMNAALARAIVLVEVIQAAHQHLRAHLALVF